MFEIEQNEERVVAVSKIELFLVELFRGSCEVKKNLHPFLDKIILQWVEIIRNNKSLDKYPHMAEFILLECDLLPDGKVCEKEIFESLRKEIKDSGIDIDVEENEVNECLDITQNTKLRKMIFRLLRHPCRYRWLRDLLRTSINTYEREINSRFSEFVEKELEKKLCGTPTILNELLRLNDIQIYSETKFSEFTEDYLSNTYMRESMVKLLEKNGINTLKKLSDIAKISLNSIPGVGTEKVQELQNVLENYSIKKNNTKIHYIKNDNGEKTHSIYHFCGVEYDDIISKIRYEIWGENNIVLDMELSLNIIHILCAKGYLYEKDIRKDKDKLLKLFKEEFPNYYLEFETFYMPSIVLCEE